MSLGKEFPGFSSQVCACSFCAACIIIRDDNRAIRHCANFKQNQLLAAMGNITFLLWE